ncbi:MAG: DinB family protein [Anaerolineales bacterium]|nr:DinB family protein [Anaerolineales bacterium]
MIDPQRLASSFALNVRIMKLQTAGLSHAESLLQLPFRGNCMNWVVGHLLSSRQQLISILGGTLPIDAGSLGRYATGSDPITRDAADIIHLDQLITALDESRQVLQDLLSGLDAAVLEQTIGEGDHADTLGESIFGLFFHETYHTGQLEILRQLAGTDDAVI